ncbi:hypothetical protein ACHAXH_002852, partial [Discostella pseudostelligera]
GGTTYAPPTTRDINQLSNQLLPTALPLSNTTITITNMPFHGQDAWRRHPLFTNLWRDPLPGFRPAVLVFSAYMVGEFAYKVINYQLNAPPAHSHGAKSGGGHH